MNNVSREYTIYGSFGIFTISSYIMAQFKWLLNKILLQRIFLLSISGAIASQILMGYIDYNNQVVEYMESMSYRQALESSRLKSGRGHFPLDEACKLHQESSPARDQRSG
ncbi:PREDICTED: uncharacterized protein LOC105452877 [Wasmannia auropunctata]|uniref:uncharacterized protein LOC105452877 n=1 Tax=Wasmannia auropunctata TaxID=64793 RepID=UPI0005EE08ED|nr:PREDICTED: uncharacterized protein LOC105452877 [Wasmannia auropunctata]